MNINTNVSMRERSKVTLSGFKGLDALSTSVDVSAIHATEMENLISRDGVNHKRYGWKAEYRIRDFDKEGKGFYPKIQGIFDFTVYGINFKFAYANKKFWLLNEEGKNGIDITTLRFNEFGKFENEKSSVAPVDVTKLQDKECKFFINNNKVYFVGMGDLLVFSKWQNDCFELRRVVGNEDVYIPTTTENIGSEEYGKEFVRISAEERNILSPYFYNTLFGAKELENEKVATYYLDTKDFLDAEITIETMSEDNKEVEIVLSRVENSEVFYKVGDVFNRGYLDLNNIEVGIATSRTYNTSKGYLRRWLKYEDYIKTKELLGWESFEVVRRNAFYYPTVESYQNYLDERFESLLGYKPDLTVTQSVETVYNYHFSVFPATINLIKFNNGALKLKNTVISYKEEQLQQSTSDVRVYYKIPSKIKSSIIYTSANSEVMISEFNVDNTEINIQEITENNISGNIKLQYVQDKQLINLAKYNETIAEIYNGITFEIEKLLEYQNGEYRASISSQEGKLELYSVKDKPNAYKPRVLDVPNIKVKLYKDIDSSIVTDSINACEFGVQGGTDRLFVVDSNGNTIRWSKDEDFTYFGDKSWCVCGTQDKDITGLDRLNDSTLLVVKEYSAIEPSIFVISGNILTEKTEANTIEYTPLFTPRGYQVGMGAVGEIVNFNGECLMVGKDGLYAVALGENMTVDSRYLLHRSRQISNKLEKYNLAKSKCVSYNGQFFIAIGKECYVADSKYTSSFKGDLQNVVNYEWWRWTNMPVNVWGFINNELWFGTEDGQICSFGRDFYDETLMLLDQATYFLDSENIVGFNLGLGINANVGDFLIPTCDFYGEVIANNFEFKDGKTKVYLPLKDYYDTEKIYIDKVEYKITKEDLYFSIDYEPTEATIKFYKNYKDKVLEVDEVVGQTIYLKDKQGKQIVFSKVKSQGGLNPANNEFSAILINKQVVTAKWVSGAMDLGTRTYSKSLTFITITGEKDLANRLEYGLMARFTDRDYMLLRANNDLNFDKLDLQTISLDSKFASSYSRRLNLRNVNFVMFYFRSQTAEDIALNSIEIEFKLNKRNIGVR